MQSASISFTNNPVPRSECFGTLKLSITYKESRFAEGSINRPPATIPVSLSAGELGIAPDSTRAYVIGGFSTCRHKHRN